MGSTHMGTRWVTTNLCLRRGLSSQYTINRKRQRLVWLPMALKPLRAWSWGAATGLPRGHFLHSDPRWREDKERPHWSGKPPAGCPGEGTVTNGGQVPEGREIKHYTSPKTYACAWGCCLLWRIFDNIHGIVFFLRTITCFAIRCVCKINSLYAEFTSVSC